MKNNWKSVVVGTCLLATGVMAYSQKPSKLIHANEANTLIGELTESPEVMQTEDQPLESEESSVSESENIEVTEPSESTDSSELTPPSEGEAGKEKIPESSAPEQTLSTEEKETPSSTENSKTPQDAPVVTQESAESTPDVPPVSSTNEAVQEAPLEVAVTPTETIEENYTFSVAPNKTTKEFIQLIGKDAQQIAWKNDLYASVMIAQAILETGSGNSQLSREPLYNLFGIKGTYKGKSVVFSTNEDDGSGNLYVIKSAFRKYPSYKESLEDYAALMKNGISGNSTFYRAVWKSQAKNYEKATAYLVGRYATDTKYNQKLNALIKAYKLTDFDKQPDDKKQEKNQDDAKKTEKNQKNAQTKNVKNADKTATQTAQDKIEIVEKVSGNLNRWFVFSNVAVEESSAEKNGKSDDENIFKKKTTHILGNEKVSK